MSRPGQPGKETPLALLLCVGLCAAACAQKGAVKLPGDTAVDSGSDTADSGDTGADSAETADSADSTETDSGAGSPISDLRWEVNANVATVLEVSWTQEGDAAGSWLEFSFEGDDWLASPELPRSAGAHTEAILGVPAETDVQFRVVLRLEDGTVVTSAETPTGTTGSLPENLPLPTVEIYDEAGTSSERYLLSSIDISQHAYQGPFVVFILDRKGRYVWYADISGSRCALFPQISGDGTHIVVEACTIWVFDDSAVPSVIRMTLDRSWSENIALPDFGFGLEEIDDGTIFYDAQDGEYALIERAPDGSEREIWSCTDYLSSIGASPGNCMPNSIIYHEETDSLLWSMFLNDTVVEIDRASGEVIRRFGQLSGGYDFDPSTSIVDYQHYPNYAADGTLMLSTHIRGDSTQQQRARQFRIDDDSETLTELWEYGEGVDEYAEYGGEAIRLANDNTLICYGTGGSLREVTYDKEVVWSVRWPSDPKPHLLGHNTLLDDLYALNVGR